MPGEVRIGISGWRYEPWRGVFYPPKLPQRRELEYASRALSTIEINGSFYSLQRPECYAAWYGDTPPGFVFAVKGGRYITHMLKLRNCERALANFFASGILITCARSSGLSSGSSRPISDSMPSDSRHSSRCCRATPPECSPSRAGAMPA